MQCRWCALHRIIPNNLTANIVVRCISTYKGMQVYIMYKDISMNKHIYKVRFVTLKFLYIIKYKIMHKHELYFGKQQTVQL